MNTLFDALPTVTAVVFGGALGLLLSVLVPTPKSRIAAAEAAGRAAAEKVIIELAKVRTEALESRAEALQR